MSARALNAGFTELHGIDEDKVLVEHARQIFPKDINSNPYNITNYHIYHGDFNTLAAIIAHINQPITFLLSSNFPDIELVKTNYILQELEQIKHHSIKTHTIMIEYIQYEGEYRFGSVSLDEIKEKILTINPYYRFSFEKGGHLEREEKAILVAYL